MQFNVTKEIGKLACKASNELSLALGTAPDCMTTHHLTMGTIVTLLASLLATAWIVWRWRKAKREDA